MEIKVTLCNCKGLCPSFKGTDMNTLPFEVERELDVSYTILHPQLCGQAGQRRADGRDVEGEPGHLYPQRRLCARGAGQVVQETHTADRFSAGAGHSSRHSRNGQRGDHAAIACEAGRTRSSRGGKTARRVTKVRELAASGRGRGSVESDAQHQSATGKNRVVSHS